MDLVEVAGDHNPFVFSFLPDGVFPNMGRFNFIHGTNTVALVVTVVISAGLVSGLQSGLLVVVSLALWIVTPALEVDEYDQILGNLSEIGGEPHSFQIHLVCVLLYRLGIAVVSGWYLDSLVEEVSWLRKLAPTVVLFLPGAVHYLVYMNCLKRELEAFEQPPVGDSND